MTDTTSPRPFVFVLMPFNAEFDDVYQLGIKKACDNAGTYVERVDEQIFDGTILSRIFNQIAKADIIIADLTGRNPNVFYETGYAHALGKRVILLTQQEKDIPFDLKHYQHIIYEGKITRLIVELEKRVRWFIENPEGISSGYNTVLFRTNGVPLVNNPTIQYAFNPPAHGFTLILDMHNSIDKVIRTARFRIAFLTPAQIDSSYHSSDAFNVVAVPEGNLHLHDYTFELLPGAWETTNIVFGSGPVPIAPGTKFNLIVRAFEESGYYDHPFVLDFINK